MDGTLSYLSGTGLAAALVAVSALTVLLYFLRPKRRPVSVPFVELFQQLLLERKSSAWRSQLRRWLSMLLSILLGGAMVLAFAGPELTPSKAGRRAVVLIDAGLRLSEDQLAEVKKTVAPWFATLGPQDEMMLVEVGARPRPLTRMTSDRAALSRGLERLELRGTASRATAAFQLAESVLATKAGAGSQDSASREVIWVSPYPPSLGLSVERVTLSYQPIAQGSTTVDSGNLAISRFAARRLLREPSQFEVLVSLESSFSEPVPVELAIFAAAESGGRGAALEVQRLVLAPTSDAPARRVILRNLSNVEWGLVAELRRTDGGEEAELRDNLARTTLAANPPLNLLIVGRVDTFLEAALLLDDSLSVRSVSEGDYPPQGRFDLTFFNDAFPTRVPSTGSAVYFGVPRGDAAPLTVEDHLEMFGFDTWDEDSPIFSALDPYDVQVLHGASLKPGRGSRGTKDGVLGASGRRPIMVQGERETGPFVALGFLPTNSDFVLRPTWPLFVLNLVDALTARARHEVQTSYRTGELWRVRVADANATSAIVRGPLTGAESELFGSRVNAKDQNSDHRPLAEERTVPVIDGHAVMLGDQPGFYEVSTKSGLRRFAANLPPLSKDAAASMSPRESDVQFSEVVPRPEHVRSEPWFWLLFGVFVVALVEWWSYHRRWTV